MNTTKVILIIGLIYVSLSYKDTSTRNMMLIMTGLIMICMLDLKEGLGCCGVGKYLSSRPPGHASPLSQDVLNNVNGEDLRGEGLARCNVHKGVVVAARGGNNEEARNTSWDDICTPCDNQDECTDHADTCYYYASPDGTDSSRGVYNCNSTTLSGYYVDDGRVVQCTEDWQDACPDGQYKAESCGGNTDRSCLSCSHIPNSRTEVQVLCTNEINSQIVNLDSFDEPDAPWSGGVNRCNTGYYYRSQNPGYRSDGQPRHPRVDVDSIDYSIPSNIRAQRDYMVFGRCNSCTSTCPEGLYPETPCGENSDTICSPCPHIEHSSPRVTVTCNSDGTHSHIDLDGSGNRCRDNYYYNTANNTCDECSTCSSGQYISQECGESTDRECAQCTPIENSSPGVTVTCTGDSDSEIAAGSENRCIEGYYYNNNADTCEPDYKTCLQLKTDNHTLACPEGVEEVSNHDTKIVHGVPLRVGEIQSDETNYHQFCCEYTKYTCSQLHSDTRSDRPPRNNKLDCTSGEFDIENSDLVSIVYDDVISHDDQRKQDLFDIACCGGADIHFSDRNECVCGENGDTPNNIACIPVDPSNIFGNGEPTLPPGLKWVTKNGTLSREWNQADILCDQGLINSYCARSTNNQCNDEIPDTAVHASP